MQADGAGQVAFPEGSTVVLRDVLRGKVWTASPYRVIRDTGTQLALAFTAPHPSKPNVRGG